MRTIIVIFTETMEYYTFIDDTPFGVKVEE